MKPTTAQRFGSLGKSFVSPSTAAAVIGAALLASGTSDTSETAWSPAAACLLPDVLPVAGTLLSYGGSRQLAAGGTVTHSGALNLGANALTVGAITASGQIYCNGVNAGTGNIANNGASTVYIGSISSYFFASHGNGVVELCGASLTGSGFGRLQLGGTTASFPAIKRSSAAIALRLADDSADAALTCGAITASGTVTVPTGYTVGGVLKFGSDVGISGRSGIMDFWIGSSGKMTLDGAGLSIAGAITASGAVQETPTQSALDPTTTNIPSGKRQGWYNSTLSEFRDWVNIGGTLLKSAAYT